MGGSRRAISSRASESTFTIAAWSRVISASLSDRAKVLGWSRASKSTSSAYALPIASSALLSIKKTLI